MTGLQTYVNSNYALTQMLTQILYCAKLSKSKVGVLEIKSFLLPDNFVFPTSVLRL